MTCEIMLENKHFKDVNPLLCGYEVCDAGHSFGPATRGYVLLHYVLSGRGVFETQVGRYEVAKGQIFIIHPDEVTTYSAHNTDPWTYAWVGFNANIALPVCFEKSVINGDGCGHIFSGFSKKKDNDGTDELYVLGKIYELLSILSADDRTQSLTQSYVRRAKNYMKNNYMQEISIDNITRQLGLDRSYFCRIFTKAEGIPPSQYLMNIRLDHAAELLSEKGYTVAQAAINSGYPDAVNFSRMFKRKFGVSPSKHKHGL